MPNAPTVRERVQELTWALVDDQITPDELQLLEGLLLGDDAARETYLDCVQLHADLVDHFALPAQPSARRTPVIGFLGEAFPPTEAQSTP
jgi:hypothetical protein